MIYPLACVILQSKKVGPVKECIFGHRKIAQYWDYLPHFLFCHLFHFSMPRVIPHFGKRKSKKKGNKVKQTNKQNSLTRASPLFLTVIDIDECVSGVHDCHSSASCTNTVGSFNCSCSHPYTGNGKTCSLVAGKYVTFILFCCTVLGMP